MEREIIASIPAGACSLLDVGAGNGTRALRIAKTAGIGNITLVEPARAMLHETGPARVLRLRAEELERLDPSFDVILCLWNVLGHIFPANARIGVLQQFARLLAPGGRVFLDVSHRYNGSHYGWGNTAARYLRDRFAWSETSGDTTVTWGEVTTQGHVFRDSEFHGLASQSGLRTVERRVVDYSTGERRRWAGCGHLLYFLERV